MWQTWQSQLQLALAYFIFDPLKYFIKQLLRKPFPLMIISFFQYISTHLLGSRHSQTVLRAPINSEGCYEVFVSLSKSWWEFRHSWRRSKLSCDEPFFSLCYWGFLSPHLRRRASTRVTCVCLSHLQRSTVVMGQLLSPSAVFAPCHACLLWELTAPLNQKSLANDKQQSRPAAKSFNTAYRWIPNSMPLSNAVDSCLTRISLVSLLFHSVHCGYQCSVLILFTPARLAPCHRSWNLSDNIYPSLLTTESHFPQGATFSEESVRQFWDQIVD